MQKLIDYCDRLVGVFGHPVSENPGVVIMDAAFQSIHAANWRFLTIDIAPEGLKDAMASLRTLGMRGINLTIPHKVAVIPYLDALSDEAKLIGAVNTVVNEDGRLVGYNTDGKGFMMALEDSGIDVAGKKIVMLGSGGVARAMGVELCLAGAGELCIYSIVEQEMIELTRILTGISKTRVVCKAWDNSLKVPGDTDILINATPLGLYPDTEACPDIDYGTIKPSMFVQDVIPNPAHTAFLRRAGQQGARTSTGMGMMINQAAVNTLLWTGKMPDKGPMAEAFDAAINKGTV